MRGRIGPRRGGGGWRPSLSGVHCIICVWFLLLGKVRPSVLFSVYWCFAMCFILGWGKPFGDHL